MQVGSFFEAYAIDNDKEKINIDNLNQICDLMNIQISRKIRILLKIHGVIPSWQVPSFCH